MSLYIAEYVPKERYQCRCCGKLPPDLDDNDTYDYLFIKYALVCREFGREPYLSSGYRCVKHNAEIGGEVLSVHTFGLAIDAGLNSIAEVERFENIVESIYPSFRMGVYKLSGTFVHLDVGYKISPRATDKWREGARWYR